mmetsp:Transcript_16813/g.23603  ORF Transcript_16813/g.23603 Transcript_16813/m.23603 type:complete len:95 (+) Transcript_16813:89-373(+)
MRLCSHEFHVARWWVRLDDSGMFPHVKSKQRDPNYEDDRPKNIQQHMARDLLHLVSIPSFGTHGDKEQSHTQQSGVTTAKTTNPGSPFTHFCLF